MLQVKLLFDPKTRKLIGGAVCGGTCTAEIANILGSLIQTGRKVDDVITLQFGTQPCLTASPIVYQITNAVGQARAKI